jgi:hypothetical protein
MTHERNALPDSSAVESPLERCPCSNRDRRWRRSRRRSFRCARAPIGVAGGGAPLLAAEAARTQPVEPRSAVAAERQPFDGRDGGEGPGPDDARFAVRFAAGFAHKLPLTQHASICHSDDIVGTSEQGRGQPHPHRTGLRGRAGGGRGPHEGAAGHARGRPARRAGHARPSLTSAASCDRGARPHFGEARARQGQAGLNLQAVMPNLVQHPAPSRGAGGELDPETSSG